MKRGLILLLMLAGLKVFAQPTVLEKAWTTAPSIEGLQEVGAKVNKLVTSVSKHHYRSDIKKLNALFTRTHTKFLHSFVQYTGIEELAKGRFNCLTATSLFADVLTKAGYNYTVIETNYHIFIVVNTEDGDVILETTDRFGGFINDTKKMNKALAAYRENRLAAATPAHHQYAFNIYKPIDTDELPGLLYFNQAVKAFNEGNWARCSEKLSAAASISKSPRISDLSALLNQRASR